VSRGRHARGTTGSLRVRRVRSPIFLLVCAFAVASGAAAYAYTTVAGNGTGQAQAAKLQAPGAGTAAQPTATSLSLSWGASSGLPAKGGYLILRSTASGGPYEKVSSGTCTQDTTLVSAATSCTDTGLTAGTTYYYEVEAAYYDISTLWVSAPDAQFSGTTSGTAATGAPVAAGSSTGAPALTSANSTSFVVGIAGSFQVTASGSPATFSDAAFSGCTPSVLPSGITFSPKGLLSGTPAASGTYTVCVNAANGVAPNATQSLTLRIANGTLAFSSPAVSGAASDTPNLGPVTVRRQTGTGTPITTGGALAVIVGSAPGVTFGSAQFGTPVTSVTIPSGASSVTFWLGSTTPGTPSVAAVAGGYAPTSQTETITAAPAGLGVALGTGSTGTPVVSCGPAAASDSCTVKGVGSSGSVVLSVGFVASGGTPAVYSATQASTIKAAGPSSGSVTIGANAAGSGPGTVTAALGTSTLTFGPYTLALTVSP
jgi:hypothetical protein